MPGPVAAMSGPGSGEGAAQAGAPVYALGSSPAERSRLRRQSGELSAHSAALLDRVGAGPGWINIDVGCGPSGTLDLLASRVGAAGRVTGLEVNPANVALARDFADECGLANVDLVPRGGGCPARRPAVILVRPGARPHAADQRP